MRYIVNADNCVLAVSFGALLNYADCDCTEYTGIVPSGWNSLEEWNEDEGNKLWRWKIINGNLVYNASAIAPEEGEWGTPNLQDKMISGMLFGQTVVKPDEGFDGLSSVTIAAQPGWKSIEAGTGQACVFYDGAQMWINTGADQIPSVVLLECTADVQSSNFLVSSMRIELTDGEITSMNATVSMNGYLYKATTFTGMSVTLSDGVLRIYCNTDTCKFYYNIYTQVFDLYRCYIMYGDTGSAGSIDVQSKTVTPSKSRQIIVPDEGYSYLSSVTIEAIPGEYINTSDATADADEILKGETAWVDGLKITGSMQNNGVVNGSVNGITTTEFSVPTGYTKGGKVTFDDTKIAEMLDEI